MMSPLSIAQYLDPTNEKLDFMSLFLMKPVK